mmetsp:Transcript_8945/g.25987  ORF Transcript_8945/g.25987 Transcript_8945/m.25987 type:complete len:100 (-) Transcript_8945:249-548(-)
MAPSLVGRVRGRVEAFRCLPARLFSTHDPLRNGPMIRWFLPLVVLDCRRWRDPSDASGPLLDGLPFLPFCHLHFAILSVLTNCHQCYMVARMLISTTRR